MLHEFMFILKKWKKNDFMGLSCDILNCRDSMAWRMNTLVLSLWMCIRLMEVVDDDLTSNLSCLSCNKSTCRHSAMINEWWVPFHVPGYNVTCWGHSSFSFRVSVRTPVSPATLISHMVCWMTVCSSPRSTSILMFQFWVFWISGSWENTCLFSLASLWFTALVDPGLAYVYVLWMTRYDKSVFILTSGLLRLPGGWHIPKVPFHLETNDWVIIVTLIPIVSFWYYSTGKCYFYESGRRV